MKVITATIQPFMLNNVTSALEAIEGYRRGAGDGRRGALKITLRPQKRDIGFKAADTGPGITSEGLGQIFEPYFSTKRRASDWG